MKRVVDLISCEILQPNGHKQFLYHTFTLPVSSLGWLAHQSTGHVEISAEPIKPVQVVSPLPLCICFMSNVVVQ